MLIGQGILGLIGLLEACWVTRPTRYQLPLPANMPENWSREGRCACSSEIIWDSVCCKRPMDGYVTRTSLTAGIYFGSHTRPTHRSFFAPLVCPCTQPSPPPLNLRSSPLAGHAPCHGVGSSLGPAFPLCRFALCRRAAGSRGLPLVSQLPLRAILRDWTFDGRQHDAAELTLKFLRGIGLFGGRWEARYMDAAGLQTPHCGAMPLLIEVTQQECTLQAFNAVGSFRRSCTGSRMPRRCSSCNSGDTAMASSFTLGYKSKIRSQCLSSRLGFKLSGITASLSRQQRFHADDNVPAVWSEWGVERERCAHLVRLVRARVPGGLDGGFAGSRRWCAFRCVTVGTMAFLPMGKWRWKERRSGSSTRVTGNRGWLRRLRRRCFRKDQHKRKSARTGEPVHGKGGVDGRGKGNTGGGDQLDGRRGHSHKRFAQLRSAGFGRVREMAMGMAMGNGGAAGLMAMGIEATSARLLLGVA